MSLSLVHIIFVAAAVLLSLAVGVALLSGAGQPAGWWGPPLGAGWLLCGVALVFYGRRVFRKLQTLK